jgi:uncharacterized membrane protein HdeD (DUF308 family)
MIRRRYNSQVKFLPRTLLAWIALILVAASLITFYLALQINSGVGPWPSLITGAIGIALGITMALWRKDVSILLGILGAISGSLLLFLVLTVFITASA